MTRVAYNGHEALTFTDYLDLGSGKTLHAEPGETYDIAPASGRAVPDIPEGWFTPAAPQAEDEDAPAEGDGASPGSREETGGKPDEDKHSAS